MSVTLLYAQFTPSAIGGTVFDSSHAIVAMSKLCS